MTLSRKAALPIWTATGFTTRDAREWMRHWGADNVEDEALLAEQARLWHDCGFTAAQRDAWDFSGDSASDLGLAIIGRVHGLGPDDDQRYCPGLLTSEDELLAAFTLYGQQDRRSLLVRWASSGLPDTQIVLAWHARLSLAEALAGGHDDDALDLLTAYTGPCPMTHRGTAAA